MHPADPGGLGGVLEGSEFGAVESAAVLSHEASVSQVHPPTVSNTGKGLAGA